MLVLLSQPLTIQPPPCTLFLPFHILATIVVLYHLTWDQVILSSTKIRVCIFFSGLFWSLRLIGSGVSQASRAVTLMWHFRAEHLVTSLFVCQIPAGLACCSSPANKNASNHIVLQGSNSCCYFIARLSLILQCEPGIWSDLFLISVGSMHKCVCVSDRKVTASCFSFTYGGTLCFDQ